MNCICGSGITTNHCCKAIVEGTQQALFPEQLMRSRYYSYCTKNIDYIYETYAAHAKSVNLKNEIADWCRQTTWLKLEIHQADNVSLSNSDTIKLEQLPTVTFSAYFIHDDRYCKMTERSKFAIEDHQWRYFDGQIEEQIELQQLTRNSTCPCNSGKKYKRCCMN